MRIVVLSRSRVGGSKRPSATEITQTRAAALVVAVK